MGNLPASKSGASPHIWSSRCVSATLVGHRLVCHRSPRIGCRRVLPLRRHALATTSAPATGTPKSVSTLAHSANVAPVVTTSSVSRTVNSADGVTRASACERASPTASIRPATLCCRCPADSPTESRTPPVMRSNSGTSTRSGANCSAAIRAHRRTGSPPRARAARAREGAQIRISELSSGGSISPASRRCPTASASARPKGRATDRRPRSFSAITPLRRGPLYVPRDQQGTPGSTRGRTATGGTNRAREHPPHQCSPGTPHPAHSRGRTRSRSVRMDAESAPAHRQRSATDVSRAEWAQLSRRPDR